MIGYPSLGLGKVAIEYDQGNKSKINDKYSKEVGEFIRDTPKIHKFRRFIERIWKNRPYSI